MKQLAILCLMWMFPLMLCAQENQSSLECAVTHLEHLQEDYPGITGEDQQWLMDIGYYIQQECRLSDTILYWSRYGIELTDVGEEVKEFRLEGSEEG